MRIATLALLSCVAALAAVPAQGRTTNRCERHARGAVAKSGQALVFGRATSSGSTRLYACVRRSGAPRYFATTEPDDDLYGSDAFFPSLRVTGRWVAGELVLGAAGYSTCTKYQAADPCPAPQHRVRVLNATSGRHVELVPTAALSGPVLVSADGVVAWLTGAAPDLHLVAAATAPAAAAGRLTATPAEVDHGAIDAASVRLTGRTLTWTRDGAPQTATISAASGSA